MTSPKPFASAARLAELALQNGWSPEEVIGTFRAIVGPNSAVPWLDTGLARSAATKGSNILQREFSRTAFAKR